MTGLAAHRDAGLELALQLTALAETSAVGLLEPFEHRSLSFDGR